MKTDNIDTSTHLMIRFLNGLQRAIDAQACIGARGCRIVLSRGSEVAKKGVFGHVVDGRLASIHVVAQDAVDLPELMFEALDMSFYEGCPVIVAHIL